MKPTNDSSIEEHCELVVEDDLTDANLNNSPEAAGLARGTARAATATGTTSATTTATAAARVARASERINTGLSAYEAAAKTSATTTATSAASTAAGGGKAIKKATTVLSKRVMVGRLPQKAVPRGATASKISIKGGSGRIISKSGGSSTARSAARVRTTSVPKTVPRRLRLQRVAKASDRLSTSFDIYEAASATNNSTTTETSVGDSRPAKEIMGNHRNKFRFDMDRIKNRIGQVFIFSETLVKNTLIGAATFGIYEKIISDFDKGLDCQPSLASESEAEGQDIDAQTDSEKNLSFIREDSFSRTSVIQHFGAGLCAGSVHGLLSIVVESSHYAYQNRHSLFLKYSPRKALASFRNKFLQSMQWFARYITHHSLAHSILFSSYEVSKRSLISLKGGNNNVTVSTKRGRENDDETETYLSSYFWNKDVLIIAFSGGVAGQIQHIASHYSENALNVSEDKFFQSDCGKGNILIKQEFKKDYTIRAMMKNFVSRGPSARSVMLSFLPSAVGFVAFEFGKEIVS